MYDSVKSGPKEHTQKDYRNGSNKPNSKVGRSESELIAEIAAARTHNRTVDLQLP